MIRHGVAPFLECSGRGDKRFSAFFARIKGRGGKSIEQIYQAAKKFPGGVTGLRPHQAKGRSDCVNYGECEVLYSKLWDEYIAENPELVNELLQWPGLQDTFGQVGHCCQATELWRIRNSKLDTRSWLGD